MEFTRASVGGGSGPLIPRTSGFNGGIVFDCPRFARMVRLTAYLSLLVRFYASHFARGSFYCNTPYGVLVGRCWAAFCDLSFAVVFSVVGNLLAFPL